MNKQKIYGILGLIAILAVFTLVGNQKPANADITSYGASFNFSENFLDKWLERLLIKNNVDNVLGGTRYPNGISADSTAPSSGQVRGTSLTITAASTLTGTTTITQSVDGLVVGGTISTSATNTAVTVYTNSTGPKMCDSDTSYLHIKNNGSFAPSLVWSLGTSTSSAVPTTNLVSSSTVATTTTTTVQPAESLFLLDSGETLVAIFNDYMTTGASSTYFTNWSAEAGVWCQDISI